MLNQQLKALFHTSYVKGGFFSESAIRFPDLQISKKKYSEKLSWVWNLNFPKNNSKVFLLGNLNFKLRIVFWNIFLEIWRFEKPITLSEKSHLYKLIISRRYFKFTQKIWCVFAPVSVCFIWRNFVSNISRKKILSCENK